METNNDINHDNNNNITINNNNITINNNNKSNLTSPFFSPKAG